jgi:hypothetical protein
VVDTLAEEAAPTIIAGSTLAKGGGTVYVSTALAMPPAKIPSMTLLEFRFMYFVR